MFEKIRERIFYSLLPKSIKKQAVNPFDLASFHMAGMPVYSGMSVRKATREGYRLSVYVYRCIRTIVQAASGIPWYVEKDGEPVDNHPFTRAWAHPNRHFSGQSNMEIIIAHRRLVGNALFQPLIVNGIPREFWMCMPDMIKPIPSEKPGEWLEGWEVTTAHGKRDTKPPEQFIHLMQIDPGDLYWGIGDLQAAARTVDTDNEAQDTQKVQLQNRNVPPGVFQFDQVLGDDQFDEATKRVREKFLQKSKRGEPWILGGGYKWQQMSLTPVEMDYILSRINNKRDIATAFGLDPWWVGDREHSTYNNVSEARRALYEDTVIPMLDDIRSDLNLKLSPLYPDKPDIAYDLSNVAALREDEDKKSQIAKRYWDMGVPFEKLNEKLNIGFQEFTGWDNSYLPFSLMPAGSAPTEPEPTKMLTKALNLETEEQKSTHWKRIDRRRMAWWGVLQKKFQPLYEKEGRAVISALNASKMFGLTNEELLNAVKKEIICPICNEPELDIDGDYYICTSCGYRFKSAKFTTETLSAKVKEAIEKLKNEWESLLTASSLALIEDFGKAIAEDIGGYSFDPTSAAIRKWVKEHAAENVTTILSTNLDEVKAVILKGVDENLTRPQIASRLRDFYSDRSTYKSMRVARTETASAAGYGQRESAKKSGVVKRKQFITSRDMRVRDSHASIDGQIRKMDEPYSIGVMYPGDPSGPVEEIVNCRCAESYLT